MKLSFLTSNKIEEVRQKMDAVREEKIEKETPGGVATAQGPE